MPPEDLHSDHPAWVATAYGAEIKVKKDKVMIVFSGSQARTRLIDMMIDQVPTATYLEQPINWPGDKTPAGLRVWSYYSVPIVIESADCTHPVCQNHGSCQHHDVGMA